MGWVKWVGLCVSVMLVSCGCHAGIMCGYHMGVVWIMCGCHMDPPTHLKWVGCVPLVILCPSGALR